MSAYDFFFNNRRSSASAASKVEASIYQPKDEEKSGDRAKDDANDSARGGASVYARVVGGYEGCGGNSIGGGTGGRCHRGNLPPKERGK